MKATYGNMRAGGTELKPTRNPAWASGKKKRKTPAPTAKPQRSKVERLSDAEEFKRRRMDLRKLTPLEDGEELYPRQVDLAEMMCVTRNTITRWEMGFLEIPAWAWKLLGYIEKENRELFAMLDKKAS